MSSGRRSGARSTTGSVALAMKGALLDGFVRSDGKDGVGHRRCSRKGSDESTAPTRLGPPLNATDPHFCTNASRRRNAPPENRRGSDRRREGHKSEPSCLRSWYVLIWSS